MEGGREACSHGPQEGQAEAEGGEGQAESLPEGVQREEKVGEGK